MRFVNRWSYFCARRLAEIMKEEHQKRSIYYFAFQVVLGSIVKNVLLFSCALLLGVFIPTLIVALVFSSLRMIAGGYHMDTYGKCLAVTASMFLIASIIAQYTYFYWNTLSVILLIVLMFIYGLYTIIRYAPKDTPHKTITDKNEIRKFKMLSLMYLCVATSIASALSALGLNIYILPISFGVLLELFTLTITGHKFFDLIKDGIHERTIK